MGHRHIDTDEWTLAAIDSAIERGGLDDWRDMFRAARADRETALNIRKVAFARDDDPGHALARVLIQKVLEAK